MNMPQDDPLMKMLVRHEGLKLKPYRDTKGILTIGIGRNLDNVGISEEEAYLLAENDVEERFRALLTTYDYFAGLSRARQAALIDMSFMGLARLAEFKKMHAALEANDFTAAASEMLASDWANEVGNRAMELASMMRMDAYLSS